MVHQKIDLNQLSAEEAILTPTYASRSLTSSISKYEIPEGEMSPTVAYNLIHDELGLDGNSRLNLATFVTTWMEPEARQLMAETFDKNMIDKDEYPQTAEIELRCVNIISRLWNAPEGEEATGCSTIGSSEAAMLGGMAMKWNWRKRRQTQGKSADKPNLVMGINVQVCWEKFCRYWEVEPRFVPVEGNRFHLSAEEAIKLIDENTSGHKYGLVYPGIGWIIWRDKKELPEELIFHCNYLGGDLPNFALNFSRPGNQVVAQYYNFLRLGREGYRKIQQACRDTAMYLSSKIAQMGPFDLITNGGDIPVFAWKLKDEVAAQTNYTLFDLADKLRERGWLVPAYTMPKNREDLAVQ
jgi:glutamate/tyrosine decarboxylase-like PLP-dependent enzyme